MIEVFQNLHGDCVIKCDDNYDRISKMVIHGIDKVEQFERNNKLVLIDNVLNHVPDTTDAQKLAHIQEIVNAVK